MTDGWTKLYHSKETAAKMRSKYPDYVRKPSGCSEDFTNISFLKSDQEDPFDSYSTAYARHIPEPILVVDDEDHIEQGSGRVAEAKRDASHDHCWAYPG